MMRTEQELVATLLKNTQLHLQGLTKHTPTSEYDCVVEDTIKGILAARTEEDVQEQVQRGFERVTRCLARTWDERVKRILARELSEGEIVAEMERRPDNLNLVQRD